MTPRPPSTRGRWPSALCAALLCGWPLAGGAHQTTATAGLFNPPVNTSASLDFILNIGKFIFFRVGTGAYPGPSATQDTVGFTVTPTIPPGGATPVTGNTSVAWSGAVPGMTVTGSNTVLPVEVRSNAGQVTVRASVVTPLASGSNTIALSQILVTSSDATLPAPLVPNSGTGTAVNVAGTDFSNLVTVRSANWTFSFTPPAVLPAGVYLGQISFTASAP